MHRDCYQYGSAETKYLRRESNRRIEGSRSHRSFHYANTRYSTLGQINQGTVGDLKMMWSFSTGIARGHEAAPLYVNGTMTLITPFPNDLYALDAATGNIKWKYSPNPDPRRKA